MEIETIPGVSVRFLTEDGTELGGAPIVLPISTSIEQLQLLCNQLLEKADDPIPIAFRTDENVEIVESIQKSLPDDKLNIEKVVVFLPLKNSDEIF